MRKMVSDGDASREVQPVEQPGPLQPGQGATLCRRERRDVGHFSFFAFSATRHSARVLSEISGWGSSRKKRWILGRP